MIVLALFCRKAASYLAARTTAAAAPAATVDEFASGILRVAAIIRVSLRCRLRVADFSASSAFRVTVGRLTIDFLR